jgi:hypothetical protein
MSAKKPSSSAQGIKNFFIPKTESKKPEPDHIVCIDLHESEPPKSMRDSKVNKFFLSQVMNCNVVYHPSLKGIVKCLTLVPYARLKRRRRKN